MGLEWIDSWWAILLFAIIGGVSLYCWSKVAIADIETKEETEMKKRVEDEFCKFYGAGATQIVLEVEVGRLRKREEFLEKKIEERDAIIKEKDDKIERLEEDVKRHKDFVSDLHKEADKCRDQILAYKLYEKARTEAGFMETIEERVMKLEAEKKVKEGFWGV